MKTINLNFKGYRLEVKKNSIPIQSGIYCVYSCTYNKHEDTVSIKKLLYIGESEDLHSRIANHDMLDDWEKRVCEEKSVNTNLL